MAVEQANRRVLVSEVPEEAEAQEAGSLLSMVQLEAVAVREEHLVPEVPKLQEEQTAPEIQIAQLLPEMVCPEFSEQAVMADSESSVVWDSPAQAVVVAVVVIMAVAVVVVVPVAEQVHGVAVAVVAVHRTQAVWETE